MMITAIIIRRPQHWLSYLVCCSSQATKIIGEPFFHFQLFNIRDQDKNSTTTPRCFDLGLSEFKFLWHHLHQKLISTSAPAAKEEYC